MKSENSQHSHVNSENQSSELAPSPPRPRRVHRRAFLRGVGMGAALLTPGVSRLFASNDMGKGARDHGPDNHLSKGDAALLRFAAAAEILETDLWIQYNELAGVIDSEEPSGSGNPAFTEALNVLDEDMSIYVHDNTDDEFTHFTFLNAYL